MKNIKFPVYFTTLFVMVYYMSPALGFPEKLIIVMFLFAPLFTLWMVYRILKDGVDTGKEFQDGYMYSDREKFSPPH